MAGPRRTGAAGGLKYYYIHFAHQLDCLNVISVTALAVVTLSLLSKRVRSACNCVCLARVVPASSGTASMHVMSAILGDYSEHEPRIDRASCRQLR